MLCLQGGAEFGPECAEMDADLLRRADGGPVVVSALAAAPGVEYHLAGRNGVRHFTELGARSARVAPDAREDADAAVAALRTARLVVLPGGSPSRLLAALQSTPLGELLRELHDDGVLVMGASAGAMVLCAWTVLPDRRGPAGPAVVPGLGLVERLLVLPHWSGGSSRADWLRAVDAAVPDDVDVVGLPEQSGLLVEGPEVTAVGAEPTRLVRQHRDLELGQTWAR